MNYKECVEKGLLRRTTILREEIECQIDIAEDYIKKAEKIFENEVFDISFLTAYISIFHSARALLYSKGYKERSHFCLFEFVREEYKDNPEIARLSEIAQSYRETRHMIQYGGLACSEGNAKEAINDAKKFLAAAKKLV
jgi:uncharacterized protein (UPF0332 family)